MHNVHFVRIIGRLRVTSLARSIVQRSSERSSLSLDQWASFFDFNGLNYGFSSLGGGTISGNAELTDSSFTGLVQAAYRQNGIVFACIAARMRLFSEARLTFRQRRNGRAGDLFGTQELSIFENPWRNGTTGDLLARAILDADLGGNFFVTKRKTKQMRRLKRMRPDWVTIILGSPDDPQADVTDLDAEVLGYVYQPGGFASGKDPVLLLADEVAHFAPIPDPLANYRGMSWILPVFRELQADTAMTVHKLKFLENGATPNMVVSLDSAIKKEAFQEWVNMFKSQHEGALNAYKTLYLGAGSTMEVVGKDFRQMEFAVTQAVGETRICAAAGVPPVLVGVTEGIKAATYSNYQQAKRYFADGMLRPTWRNFAASMSGLIDVPAGAELWYDERDITFLLEDAKDAAEILGRHTTSIRTLTDAGFEAASVLAAVTSGDLTQLKHTGLFSVQLQPPGTVMGQDKANNGSGVMDVNEKGDKGDAAKTST